MVSAQDFDSSDEQQKLLLKWMAAGHDIIHDRGTFRHVAYKKDLPGDMPIKQDGGQLVTSTGHGVVAGDCLPERVDLCTDADGNLLSQQEFERRYKDYLQWFQLVEGSDPEFEWVPNCARWLTEVHDTFSESPGMVEIGYDARKPAPASETEFKYDPRTNEIIEQQKQMNEGLSTTLDAVKTLLEDRKSEPVKRGPGRPRKEA